MITKHKPVILIVDDEEENLDLLERTLMFDYEVHRASSGEEALALVEKLPKLAMIITDQRMPGMTGTELLVKAAGKRAEAIRMIVTGYTSPDDLIEAINSSNVYRFLTKPWDVDELLAIVRRGVRLSSAGVGGLVHEITGMPGPAQLVRELRREILHAKRLGYDITLEAVVLPDLTQYEEEVGSAAAEESLRRVADTLASGLPTLGFLAALNGGVFVRFVPGLGEELVGLDSLRDELAGFFRSRSGQQFDPSAIEVRRAVFPKDGDSEKDLIATLGLTDLLEEELAES